MTRRLLLTILMLLTLAEAALARDERLDKKVSYSGYARLHEVARDLSSASGVTIRCGKTVDDWRVRDIPVVVCVKDMPLGKLLKALSYAGHTQFTGSKTQGGRPPTYRLARDAKLEREITSSADAKIASNRALANWAWDVLVAYAKAPGAGTPAPDSTDGIPPGRVPWNIGDEEIRLVGRILGSVSPAEREKAFSGEQVTLEAKNASQSADIRALYRAACKDQVQYNGLAVEPTDEDVENAAFLVKAHARDRSDPEFGLSILVPNIPTMWGERRSHSVWSAFPGHQAERLTSVKGLRLPPCPQVDGVLKPDDAFPSPNFRPLKEAADWKLPALQKRVKIELPKDKKRYLRPDVLSALSTSSGLNIICEDFNSHKFPDYCGANTEFGPDPTAADVLQKLDYYRRARPILNWFENEGEGLVVGWAVDWRERHNHMAPQSLFDRINKVRRDTGAELDDVTPLLDLTQYQFREWVSETAEFPMWEAHSMIHSEDTGLWRLYNKLNAKDRKLAKSPAGLPLAKIDPERLGEFLRDQKREAENGTLVTYNWEYAASKPELEVFSSPELISTLVMRITRAPLEEWIVTWVDEASDPHQSQYTARPDGVSKHGYTMELTGEKDGEPFTISSKLNVPFPVFMPDKEVRIHKLDPNGRGNER